MSDTTWRKFNLRLPDDLIEELDRRSEANTLSRNETIIRALRWAMEATEYEPDPALRDPAPRIPPPSGLTP